MSRCARACLFLTALLAVAAIPAAGQNRPAASDIVGQAVAEAGATPGCGRSFL